MTILIIFCSQEVAYQEAFDSDEDDRSIINELKTWLRRSSRSRSWDCCWGQAGGGRLARRWTSRWDTWPVQEYQVVFISKMLNFVARQCDINCGPFSHPDFIKNYSLSNSPFPPNPNGRAEQSMSPCCQVSLRRDTLIEWENNQVVFMSAQDLVARVQKECNVVWSNNFHAR